MYKIDLDTAKKSTKQIMIVSAFATLLLAAMSSVPTMKSYALSLSGLLPSFGSNDRNDRSIDTDNFLSCLGVGTDCTNVNKHVKPTTTSTPTPPPSSGGCDNCFAQFLNPTQLGNLKFVLGVPVAGTDAQLCAAAHLKTEAELRAAIVEPVVGVTAAVADNIIACLKSNGFVFAQ
jgi:hypothetical protein